MVLAVGEPDSEAASGDQTGASHSLNAGHIRGSSLLLLGRVVALCLSGATQVIIVRYLSKSDYGAFAYALTVASFIELIATIVHRQSLTRFLSLYEEERDYDKLFGTIIMVMGLIFATALSLFAFVLALRSPLTGAVGGSLVMRIVLIMFALGALEAIDDVFEGMFAVFSRPRAIFFRKYLLTPMLQLAIASVTVIGGHGVEFLAIGTVLGWAIAVAVYFVTLLTTLRDRGLLEHFRLRRLSYPIVEVFGFGIPLITTQLVFLCTNTISVILLENMKGTTEVARLRAILPLADLNQLVIFTFTLLFMPMAARLFIRGDHEGMRSAYWESAIWLAVLSFPLFAMTGPLARSLTLTLFGERYGGSASVLAVLSIGFYFSAALGFNALTLQTYGRLRFVAIVNMGCVIIDLILTIALIPPFGALGVAIATCATLVVQNLANQFGLRREVGIPVFERRFRRVYATIAVVAIALALIQMTLQPPLVGALAIAAVASLAILVVNRRLLNVAETFPELTRVPLLRALLR